jgi:hypothetical protein
MRDRKRACKAKTIPFRFRLKICLNLAGAKPVETIPTKLDWAALSDDKFVRLIFPLTSKQPGYENLSGRLTAGIFHSTPMIGDLRRPGRRFSGGKCEPPSRFARDNLDLRLASQPRLRGRRLPVR